MIVIYAALKFSIMTHYFKWCLFYFYRYIIYQYMQVSSFQYVKMYSIEQGSFWIMIKFHRSIPFLYSE